MSRRLAVSLSLVLAVSAMTACSKGSPEASPSASRTPRKSPHTLAAPSPRSQTGKPTPSPTVDPGTLRQTHELPSSTSAEFDARMGALWNGIATGKPVKAMPAFFPETAYAQVKAVADPAADFQARLVSAYKRDIAAAHELLGADAATATFVGVSVPHQWNWVAPGDCYNTGGYWHAPGSRLLYRVGGELRSFGVFSLISWRGEWYVVHLSSYDQPGTVDSPAVGKGAYGPAGGC